MARKTTLGYAPKRVRSLKPYSEIIAEYQKRDRQTTLMLAYFGLATALFAAYLAAIAISSR